MINVTELDLGKSPSTAQLREKIKYATMTREFKVNGREGVEVGKPGDYLIEFADGVRGVLSPAEFDAAYETVHKQTAKTYLEDRGLNK
jgi:hypothetical protein